MAQTIVQPWLQPEQVQLPLYFPYVVDEAELQVAWKQAASQVWEVLATGQDVAFVSEGDINFFSTFTYLAQTLQAWHPDVQIEAVPGITSPLAAAAALGLPLAIASQRVTILPAMHTVANLETALQTADVLVLMKVSSVYDQVWPVLQRYGLLQRSYIVERATLPDQKIYRDLCDRPSLELPYFSLLIVQIRPPESGNLFPV
jgi:precorrin-2/cobalt-factor-2 C20-methyltransferase